MGLYSSGRPQTLGTQGVGDQAEIRLIETRQQRRRRIRTLKKEFKRETVDNVKGLRRAYPWMAPEAVYTLANKGHGPGSKVAVEAAGMASMRAMKKGNWNRPGETSHTTPRKPDMTPDQVRAQWNWVDNPKKAKRQTERAIKAQLSAGLNETGIDDPLSALDYVTDVLPVVGSVKAAVQGDAASAFTRALPGGGMAEKLRESAPKVAEEVLAPIPGATGVVRGVGRGFMLAAQVPNDMVSAAVRRGASGVQALVTGDATAARQWTSEELNPFANPGNVESAVKQSQAGQALLALIRDPDDVDVGGGWFPDPESMTGRAAAKAARQAAPTIGGHAFTAGRFIANIPFDPDTLPFDAASGFVDAVVATKYDPSNIPFDAYTASRRAGKTFAAMDETQRGIAEASLTAQQAERALAKVPAGGDIGDLQAAARQARLTEKEMVQQAAGVVTGGHRKATMPKQFTQYIQSDDARPVIDWGVENTSAYESWLKYGRQGTTDMHTQLAAANTPEAHIGVLARYAGGTEAGDLYQLPKTRNFTMGYRPGENRRAFAMAPTGANAYFNNPEGAVREADRFARNANLSPELRAEVMEPFFTYQSNPELHDAMTGLHAAVATKLNEQYKIPQDLADWITHFEPQGNEIGKAYGVDETGHIDAGFADLGPDGKLPAAMLPTELATESIPFADFREIRRAMNTVGRTSYQLRNVARSSVDAALKHIPEGPDYESLRNRVAGTTDRAGWKVISPHTGKDVEQATPRGGVNVFKAVKDESNRLAGLSDEAAAKGLDKASSQLRNAAVMMRTSGTADWGRMAGGSILTSGGALWRRSKLARPAWGLRVVGEEQARMWAYGFVGAFNDPMTAAAIVAGHNPSGKFAGALKKVGVEPQLVAGVKVDQFRDVDELQEAMMDDAFIYGDAVHQGLRGPTVDVWDVIDRPLGEASQTYTQGIVEELARLAKDPAAKKLAGMNRVDQRAFLTQDPGGRKLWENRIARSGRLAKSHPGQTERKLIRDMTDQEKNGLMEMWLDGFNSRVANFTQGNTQIRDAITSGELNGVKVKLARSGDVDKSVTGEVERMLSEGWEGPAKVRVRDTLVHPRARSNLSALGESFDRLMYNLMPRESNYLSRSPLFRQVYWRSVGELAPGMDPKAIHKIVDGWDRAAKKAGWAEPEQLAQVRAQPGLAGGLDIDAVDQIAKGRALATTRDILYDLSERGQVFDMLREVMPFGEAWKEVLTRWARAVHENPKIVHRLDQGIQSMREQGVLHKDQFGQEVLTLPGSTWLTDKLIGVPTGIDQSLQGANIIGNIFPGIGPAITVPLPIAAQMVGFDIDQPGVTRDAMELIYPYGRNDTGQPDTDILNAILPTSVARGLKYFKVDDPSVQSTLNYYINYKASTGNYDLNGTKGKDPRSEMQRLVNDAETDARQFQIMRALGSAFFPSAPIPKYHIRDADNKLMEARVASNQFYAWEEEANKRGENGFAVAFDKFIKLYGEKNFLVTQGFTKPNALGLPRTKKQLDWVNARGYLRDLGPETYGLLVHPDEGEGDLTEYNSQIRRKERTRLTGMERVELANERLAYWIRDKAVAEGITDDDEKKLDEYLVTNFPGYKKIGPDPYKARRRIAEVERTMNDPRVMKDPETAGIAKTVRTYLAGRAAIIAEQQLAPYKSTSTTQVSTGKSVKPLRKKLRNLAEELKKKDPRFGGYWRYLFQYEVQEPEES